MVARTFRPRRHAIFYYLAFVSERNIPELLGEGGPEPSFAIHHLSLEEVRRDSGASANDSESYEHSQVLQNEQLLARGSS